MPIHTAKRHAPAPAPTFYTLHAGPTSAEVVRDIFKVHFPDRPLIVLDLTFGRGTFWRWNHEEAGVAVITNDLYAPATFRWDVTKPTSGPLPKADVVVFDPPHAAVGTPSDGLGEWAQRYGSARNRPSGVRNYLDVMRLVTTGTRTALALAHEGAVVKTQPVVESGIWHHTPYYVEHEAIQAGWRVDGWWLFHGPRRPQPSGRRQQHPRNTVSVFYVFKRGDSPC